MPAAFPSKSVAKVGKGRAKLERPKKTQKKPPQTGLMNDQILMKLQQVLVPHEHSCRRVGWRRCDPHHLTGEDQIRVTVGV